MIKYYIYVSNQKVPTLSANLSWSHFDELLKIKDENIINYYITISEEHNLSVRQLRSRIKSKEYERLDEETKNKLIETLINNGESISGDSIKDMADAKGYSWIYDTSYWLGTVYNNTVDRVLSINTDGVFDEGLYTYTIGFGVRPVITINA